MASNWGGNFSEWRAVAKSSPSAPVIHCSHGKVTIPNSRLGSHTIKMTDLKANPDSDDFVLNLQSLSQLQQDLVGHFGSPVGASVFNQIFKNKMLLGKPISSREIQVADRLGVILNKHLKEKIKISLTPLVPLSEADIEGMRRRGHKIERHLEDRLKAPQPQLDGTKAVEAEEQRFVEAFFDPIFDDISNFNDEQISDLVKMGLKNLSEKKMFEAGETLKKLQEHLVSNFSTSLEVPHKLKDEDIAFLSELRKTQKTAQSARPEGSGSTHDRFLKQLSELDAKKANDLELLEGRFKSNEIVTLQYNKERLEISETYYYKTTAALATYRALSADSKDSIKRHD